MVSVIQNKRSGEIIFINLTSLLFLFRTALPEMKYLFLVLYFGAIIYFVINYWRNLIDVLIRFAKSYTLVLILILILIIAFLFSDKLYLIVFKDIINIVVILSLFFILNLLKCTKRELDFYVLNLLILFILFGIVVSLVGFTDLFALIKYEDSFKIDYNFAILPVCFGIIALLYLIPKTTKLTKRSLLYVLLAIFITYLFLSGSRRGTILILGVTGLLLIIQILTLLFGKSFMKKDFLRFKPEYLFITSMLIIIPAFIYLFLFHTSYEFKNSFFKLMGTNNISLVKYKITNRYFRFATVFGKEYNYPQLFNRIWDPIFKSDDPDRGWGTRIHTTVFPLTGDSVNIVPAGSKGYCMDNTCEANTWDGNAYSFTEVWSGKVSPGDSIAASVYCYVSNDFNGDWVRLSTEGATSNNIIDYYQLDKKGTWQKLKINPDCGKGNALIFLFFCKNDCEDFTSLKGEVIFAYPQIQYLQRQNRAGDSSGSVIEKEINSQYSEAEATIYKYLTYSASSFNIINYAKLFKLNVDYQEKDLLRRITSRFISEDTTYHGPKSQLSIDSVSNAFLNTRLLRWKFALQIFFKEFNLTRKVFGGGFNFMNWYGNYFEGDTTKSDYPHNPFLSILLYSGIIGLVLYLILFYRIVKYYFQYIKEYSVLSICFCITFFITFFSSATPFDPPVMGFFVILPFFLLSISQKNSNNT